MITIKKTRNTYLALTLFIGFALIPLSCSEDFTNVEQEFEVGVDEFFLEDEAFFELLISAYDPLSFSWQTQLFGEFMSDNSIVAGEDGCQDIPEFQRLGTLTFTTTNIAVARLWDSLFGGVFRASFFLDNAQTREFENKDVFIAEARFLRALFYFELVRNFGGVPLKESRFLPGDETSIPRSSIEETYDFIENDLNAAIPDLPMSQAEIGRVTKAGAMALLGKVKLYQEDWDGAIEALTPVTSMGFALLPNFGDVFTTEGENGVESVFEIQYSNAEAGNWNNWQENAQSEGNIAAFFSGPRLSGDPIYDAGFSFNIPQADLVDLYELTDTRKSATILNLFEYLGVTTEQELIDSAVEYTPGCGTDTGVYYNKIIPRTGEIDGGNQFARSPYNHRYIRYADVLLMLAEAHNRSATSNENLAKSFLRQVVDRAHGSGVVSIPESGVQLTERIWEERRLEFAGEGDRFYDLVRTGQATSRLPGFETGKHELFPIPEDEILFSQGNWGQNPGW
ncbi:RagB/SusD family nutrient uptake outer membrane protein [Aquimarina litoralis]|uniref:RagB/SusD family nutrient uptake outer membrane protein n=1 Tax=Aquimarina litoralis TaxID=584605 RepID=UPI001C5769F8|nr:RagB/SusD family nutrient uptake outer membrane protein [Aquimarina litoralis]MBW1297102.1 RagB/SusD family nutrient uptake outer membrane protein [Aquimarina litoralis]